MTFREFLHHYRERTLHKDAAWRGYNIPEAVIRPTHIRSALKTLKLSYAGELALPEFMARYEVATREEATKILGWYWLWLCADQGRPVKGLERRRAA